MNILLTTQRGILRDVYFPAEALRQLKDIGELRMNDTESSMTPEALAEALVDVDVCVTHWTSPKFTDDVLARSGRLRLIAHAAGSVAQLATEEVYRRQIKVCSANSVMARFVAEATLGYMIAALRLIPQNAARMHSGDPWDRRDLETRSLFGERVGLIGLGTVGACLLPMLAPFGVSIKLYDPYISSSLLAANPSVELCSLEEVLSWSRIVSVHASLTPETYHMLGAGQLKLIPDGGVIINTSRGAVFDEAALTAELSTGRLRAVLDVFEHEPPPADSPLRSMENVILQPHLAGAPARAEMTFAIVEDIRRFAENKPLRYEVPVEQFRRMTRTEFIGKG